MIPEIKVVPPEDNIPRVKSQVASAVFGMLKNGRRYFGSSAASLTHQAFNPAYRDKGIDPTLAKIGLEGERDTTIILKKWMEDKPNAVLIDSVHLRGLGEEELDPETGFVDGPDTDHIIVIGTEIVLIDTKRWKSKRNYEVADDGTVLRAKKQFPGGNLKMNRAVRMWLDYVDGDIAVTGIVHINAEETTVFRNRNWYKHQYNLVESSRFTDLLDEKWALIEPFDREHINSSIISQIVVNAVKPYDARTRVFHMPGLADFK